MTRTPALRLSAPSSARRQRGVTTLVVSLVVLVLLTIIILASTNVALLEQRTTTNENRSQLAQQSAEFALNLAGEYLKANVQKLTTDQAGGWFETGATKWVPCPQNPTDANHPCRAEPDQNRRTQLYYYASDGAAHTNAADTQLDLPYNSLVPSGASGGQLGTVGGASGSSFTATARVNALLCRLDTTPGQNPSCRLTPANGNRIAVTLIAQSNIQGEAANSLVKETWGTYSSFSATSAVPLVAAGLVQGLGNATIVAAPNAGGPGVAGSIWSPRDVDIDDSGSGVGSVATCHLGDYLHTYDLANAVPASELKTTCAGNGNPCSCSANPGSQDFLSGHTNAVKQENLDILDVDHIVAGTGNTCTSNDSATDPQPIPDIGFFPGKNRCGDWMDTSDPTDDNLFEWIFARDVTGAADGTDNHGAINYAAEDAVLNELAENDPAHILDSQAKCAALGVDSEGVYYVPYDSSVVCDVSSIDSIGSPTKSVIIVLNEELSVHGNFKYYGMLFIRDSQAALVSCGGGGATSPACLKGTGGKFFGSVVVEGNVDLAGNPHIVYVDTTGGGPNDPLPERTRFARLPGSWFDDRRGL
jgi:Tfp pilus assembly protein PilX